MGIIGDFWMVQLTFSWKLLEAFGCFSWLLHGNSWALWALLESKEFAWRGGSLYVPVAWEWVATPNESQRLEGQ